MWTMIFGLVVGVLYFVAKLKELKDGKKAIEAMGGINTKYQLIDYSKKIKIVYLVLAVFGLGSGIYGLILNDSSNVALGILVFFLFLGEFLMGDTNYKFYYSPSSFFYRGKAIRYKSIKEIEKTSRVPFAFATVVTYNGDKVRIPPKAKALVEEHLAKKELKVEK